MIDGAGRTLSLAEGDTLQVQNSLTLQNVKLDMDGATLTYTGSGSKKEVVFKNTVTGTLSYISDTSGARYLSIVLEDDSFVFETITGTTTDDNLQMPRTTLYLTGFGSEEDPVDLYNKVVDLSAIELDNCWLTASVMPPTWVSYARPAQFAGRTDPDRDTTLAGFGLKENGKFEVRMPANATLTVTEKYSRQYPRGANADRNGGGRPPAHQCARDSQRDGLCHRRSKRDRQALLEQQHAAVYPSATRQ